MKGFTYTNEIRTLPGGATYYDVEQGSDYWFDLRKGVPTASRFDMVLTPKTAKPSASQKRLIAELIGERFGQIDEGAPNYTSRAMEWGQRAEDQARLWYQALHDVRLRNGGFILSSCGRWGASPDSIVPQEDSDLLGGIELKCPQPATHAGYLLDPEELLADYRCQVHGHLIVAGLAWVDLMSFCPGLDAVCLRVTPDDFTAKLAEELARFSAKFSAILQQFKPADVPAF